MSVETAREPLTTYCRDLASRAKAASRALARRRGGGQGPLAPPLGRGAPLANVEAILEANARDIDAAPGYGLSAAAIDRLTLTDGRIEAIAAALDEVAGLPDPVGEGIESHRRPNGLAVSKVRVPLGVIFMMYESRPNVTADAAALCVKSGNAAILRGGKEARLTNLELHRHPRRSARRRRPAGATPSSTSRRPTAQAVGLLLGHARVHRPGDPPRRRGPDPPRRRRGEDAGPEALSGQLPRLRRRRRRPGDGRLDRPSTPRPSGPASATPPRPCLSIATIAPAFLPEARRGAGPRAASSSAATRRAGPSSPR